MHEASLAPEKTNPQQKRKWRKKSEPEIHTKFQVYSFNVFVDASTPLKMFLNFLDEDIIKKIHFELNLKSLQKNKPASITDDKIKTFLGSTLQ